MIIDKYDTSIIKYEDSLVNIFKEILIFPRKQDTAKVHLKPCHNCNLRYF